MFATEDYELVDFGNSRKLERFGPHLLDRPCPAAEGFPPANPRQWPQSTARFRRTSPDHGRWEPARKVTRPWSIRHEEMVFQLKATRFGHLGIFPEQAPNWTEIRRRIRSARRPIKLLNLFAYTGGSTLAAAAAGAEVVHVEAAKNVVSWARTNARNSDLEDAPIRWITEDVQKFVQRELRRGNRYDAIVLDPPSYGHGPQGESWKISRDLGPLLMNCHELTRDRRAFVLLTCHSAGFGPAEMQALVSDTFCGSCQAPVVTRRMYIAARDGRRLDAGVSVLLV
jgi:23S rRNA (cytosine1962-C5)-methyltransferase